MPAMALRKYPGFEIRNFVSKGEVEARGMSAAALAGAWDEFGAAYRSRASLPEARGTLL
jgi:hypothetical protein